MEAFQSEIKLRVGWLQQEYVSGNQINPGTQEKKCSIKVAISQVNT